MLSTMQLPSYPHEVHSSLANMNEEEYTLSHPPMIPLTDLCTHFPDLPSFVHHPDFDHFAYCWMEFQYHTAMSQHPASRPGVRTWLVSMSVKLTNLIAKYPPPHVAVQVQENHEASTSHIRSAYQRLVHRFGVLYKLLDIIDHGTTVANQSPQETILPIYNTLYVHKLDQQHRQHRFNSVSSLSSSSSGTSTPIIQYPLLSLSSSPPSAITTSSFRSLSCMEVIPYLNDSCAPSPHIHPMSVMLPSPNPIVQTPLVVQSSSNSSWSTPVTPSTTTTMFWSSCPVSPLDPFPPLVDTITISASMDESITPLEVIQDEESSEYYPEDEDEYQPPPPSPKSNKRKRPSPSPSTKKPMKRRRRTLTPLLSSTTPTTANNNNNNNNNRQRNRTATSYDQDTTHFLKSMFFNVYSQRDKLTKEQRRQVVERTGLKPRNVTYWFSNHKRRFQADLDVFRKLMVDSHGRIQTYDDYVAWRREQGFMDDMMDDIGV